MVGRSTLLLLVTVLAAASVLADGSGTDTTRDILITFENEGARASGVGMGAPYKNRKRYTLSAEARRNARAIASEYSLAEVDHWPIRSLSVYCFVYRIPAGSNRQHIVEKLRSDARIESVQALQEFETGIRDYDDTYASLQHGLVSLDIEEAHRYSTGNGVRVAIIDSHVDTEHEDLKGRISRVREFADESRKPDVQHGTAVASLIAANANNARGIVGVAPEADIEVLVACWAEDGARGAVCDSFTLAKALDTMLEDPPQVLNLSLQGPQDPLVGRLLLQAFKRGVIIVAASAGRSNSGNGFPADLEQVIGVDSSNVTTGPPGKAVYAPGKDILVAAPNNTYDFRSGSSLAAAHASGVIALLLAVAPELPFHTVKSLLQQSQTTAPETQTSINACVVLQLADTSRSCRGQLAAAQT